MKEQTTKSLLDRGIIKISHWASYIFVFIVIISFYEILMRYVFDMPTTWVHDSASFLGGVLFVLGGAYALATDKHVRVVLVYDMVSKKARVWLNIFHHIMGIAFSSLMIYASYNMTREAWLSPDGSIHLQTTGSAWDMPLPALLKAVILLISCVMLIQFFIHLCKDLKKAVKKSV